MKKEKKIFNLNERYRQYLLGIDFDKMLDDEVIAKKFIKKINASVNCNEFQIRNLQEKLIPIASKQRKIYLLGLSIRRTREARRISATALGEKSKLSPSLISKIENGKSYLPKTSSLVSIAKVLKVNPNIFLDIIKDDSYANETGESNLSWEEKVEGALRQLEIRGDDLDLVIEFIKLIAEQINKRHGRKE